MGKFVAGKYRNKDCGVILGVGLKGAGKYLSHVRDRIGNSVPTKEYQLWLSMLNRCYSKSYQKRRPTYTGCTVSEEFKSFQFFAEWCQSQIGFGIEGWSLDKDIIVEGNKEYSQDTCAFVPRQINSLLVDNKRVKGVLPTGVGFSKQNNKFVANITKRGKSYNLGYFYTIDEAFLAYKAAKESYIKEVADQWKADIDPRVYFALINRSILPD